MKKKTIVISQPMFFPWSGLFNQIKMADVFVHYDDAQFTKGGFLNRVQLKSLQGSIWWSAPVEYKFGSTINETRLSSKESWQKKHIKMLEQSFAREPHKEDVISLVNEVYQSSPQTISDLNILCIEKISEYLGFKTKFILSSDMNSSGHGAQKVIDLVKQLDGTHYLTGHGAKKYFDHGLAEQAGITMEYIDYNIIPYPQKHGDFVPYVSIVDMIASVGKKSINHMASQPIYWKEFIHG